MISAVDNNIICGMSEATSGAYCQQLTAIRGATCICDPVFKPSCSPCSLKYTLLLQWKMSTPLKRQIALSDSK